MQHKLLENSDVIMADKLKLLADGIVQNWGMWITEIAFIVVILLVNLIRTRSFDYAWRIAIVAGGVVYVLVILAGGFYFGLNINVIAQIIYTVISVVIGLLLEFSYSVETTVVLNGWNTRMMNIIIMLRQYRRHQLPLRREVLRRSTEIRKRLTGLHRRKLFLMQILFSTVMKMRYRYRKRQHL